MLRHWREAVFITRATYVAWQCATDVCDLYRTLSITLTLRGCGKAKVASCISVSPFFFSSEVMHSDIYTFHRHERAKWWSSDAKLELIFFCIIYNKSRVGVLVLERRGVGFIWHREWKCMISSAYAAKFNVLLHLHLNIYQPKVCVTTLRETRCIFLWVKVRSSAFPNETPEVTMSSYSLVPNILVHSLCSKNVLQTLMRQFNLLPSEVIKDHF